MRVSLSFPSVESFFSFLITHEEQTNKRTEKSPRFKHNMDGIACYETKMVKKLFYYITIFTSSSSHSYIWKFMSCHGILGCHNDASSNDVESSARNFENFLFETFNLPIQIKNYFHDHRLLPRSFMTPLIIIPSIVFTKIRNKFFALYDKTQVTVRRKIKFFSFFFLLRSQKFFMWKR